MNPELEPLDPELKAVLAQLQAPQAPAEFREAVWRDLAPHVAAGTGAGVITISKTMLVLGGVALFGAGVGVGAWLDSTRAPEEMAAPIAVPSSPPEKIVLPDVNPAPPAQAPARAVAAPAPSKAPTMKVPKVAAPEAPHTEADDVSLALERQALETARQALARGDGAQALKTLEDARQKWPRGTLAEERDALTVQAFVLAQRENDARGAWPAFRSKYPESLFLPALEAVVKSLPK